MQQQRAYSTLTPVLNVNVNLQDFARHWAHVQTSHITGDNMSDLEEIRVQNLTEGGCKKTISKQRSPGLTHRDKNKRGVYTGTVTFKYNEKKPR